MGKRTHREILRNGGKKDYICDKIFTVCNRGFEATNHGRDSRTLHRAAYHAAPKATNDKAEEDTSPHEHSQNDS